MMRVLIVDDEAPARARMRKLLKSISDIEVIGEAAHGIEALEQAESLKPDLIFLDIEMPELDGISVARSLGSQGPSVVFVTAYDEFALKAFETHATDYLMKPVAEARLKMAIDKVRASRTKAPDLSALLDEMAKKQGPARLAIKSGDRYVVVDLNRVSVILAKDHYAAIQCDGRELLSDDTLDVFEKKLDPKKFVRIHRSAIVNIDFVQELEREGDRKFTAVLSDTSKTRVAIARERLDDIRKRLGL